MRLTFFALMIVSVCGLSGCPTAEQPTDSGLPDAGANAGPRDGGTTPFDAGPPGTWDNSMWDNGSYQ